jgi:EAL domain-containing protein (putative c-di-GMP-specific phosphodiesterase class I)
MRWVHELMSRTIADQIGTLLQQVWLDPDDLEIEITERDIFDTKGQGITILEELRSRGIAIVLDDFGSGYSSLSYLRRLPIDRLKLDRQFLQDIPQDRASRTIVESVISMAHAINVEVIAEGVESFEQADFFRKNHCDAMQGFFFSRPLPARDITQLLLDPARRQLWPKRANRALKSND